jgi:hypothetical protein
MLVDGCSTLALQPVPKVANDGDRVLMDRLDRVQQPYLSGRYRVNCPQIRARNNDQS